MVNKGKGGKKGLKNIWNEGQKASQNSYQALEENEEIVNVDQSMDEGLNEKEKEGNDHPTQEMGNEKEIMMSETELELDQEMIQSETDMEDQELQEILDK